MSFFDMFKFKKLEDSDWTPPWQWQPIATAPDDTYLLLGWKTDPTGEFDYLISTGKLSDGRWIDGPGARPDFWMEELPIYNRKPMATAPSDETIVLFWDSYEGDQRYYDFDVGELSDGRWIQGGVQPDWWMYAPVPRDWRSGIHLVNKTVV